MKFDDLSVHEYLKWLHLASELHSKGFFPDIDEETLAQKIYQKRQNDKYPGKTWFPGDSNEDQPQ
jgi:hypothetical protein